MKRVLLSGYYGFGNLGDEAVLSSIVCLLKKEIPDVKITALSNDPKQTSAAYGIDSVNRWKLGQVWRAMRRADIFVFGGGSLLQDVTSSKSILYYLSQIALANFVKCPVFLYAQGIGPINDKNNRKKIAKRLNSCAYITVRDNASASLLERLGVNKAKVAVTADPVLAGLQAELSVALPHKDLGKKVGFAIRFWHDLDIPAIAKAADWLDHQGWQVIFLPFHEPDDRTVAEEIMNQMESKAFLPKEILSAGEMLGAISQLDFLVGMRLHSLVMAASAQVPFLGIGYDPKVDAFCRQAGQPKLSVQELDENSLQEVLDWALPDMGNTKNILKQKQSTWQTLCHENMVLLREYAFGAKNLRLEDIREQSGEVANQ